MRMEVPAQRVIGILAGRWHSAEGPGDLRDVGLCSQGSGCGALWLLTQ